MQNQLWNTRGNDLVTMIGIEIKFLKTSEQWEEELVIWSGGNECLHVGSWALLQIESGEL